MPLTQGLFDHATNEVCTVDFETEAIGPRPAQYPPVPVGVSIRWPNGFSEYLAWGHPVGNNCTFEQARTRLWTAWQHPCLFHNSAFDMEVAFAHLGFPAPRVWHDTYFLLFLCYPHAQTYSLKPTAEWLLSEPPTEQDAMRDWIVKNVPGATKKNFGAHISKAPVSLVEPYAIGDCTRTYGIFRLLWPHVRSRMMAPYMRERALMPVLTKASRRGIRVNRELAGVWDARMLQAITDADARLHALLGPVNLDANEELADALENCSAVEPDTWPLTSTGKRSVSKKSIAKLVADPVLRDLILYRNTAATLQRTFLTGWLDASQYDGRLHCQWHQVKSDDGGARTGRIASSAPNLANVPNPQDRVVVPAGLPPLPNLRKLLLPEEGCVWVSADYASQELRHAAHFEAGPLMEAYQQNPDLDLHEYGRAKAHRASGLAILGDPKDGRKKTKIVNFSTLYGAGIDNLSEQLDMTDKAEVRKLRDVILDSMGNLRRLRDQATQRWRLGKMIRTWGGREVPCQPPIFYKGQRLTFEYKALNMLIQGSAADQTKEALVRLDSSADVELLSQLYDEINSSVPTDMVAEGVRHVRECMEDIQGFDVPFTTDVEVGPTWGDTAPYQEEKHGTRRSGHAALAA